MKNGLKEVVGSGSRAVFAPPLISVRGSGALGEAAEVHGGELCLSVVPDKQ